MHILMHWRKKMSDDTIFSEYIKDTDIKVSISLFKGKYRVDIRKF